MATKTFQVKKYELILGDAMEAVWRGVPIKARGILDCRGATHHLLIYFLNPDSQEPHPIYDPANKVGAIFLRFSEMAQFVDLVRNEKPVYAYLNDSNPEWNSISTSKEPVVEAE